VPDSPNHRLFIGRQNRVMVVEEDSGTLPGEVGVIQGAHGTAVVNRTGSSKTLIAESRCFWGFGRTPAAVFSQPIGGYLSDHLRMRRLLIIISSILMGLICLFPFAATGWMIPVLIIGLGIVSGTIVPATFAAVPEVMAPPQLAGIGMAVLALGQNLGMLIGPIMFGKLVEAMGWAGAGYTLIPVCAISVVAVCLAKFR